MSKEKEKAGDTPEELDMLFGKNRIYMLDFEHRTRKMYAYAYAQPHQKAISKEWKRGCRAAVKKRYRRMPEKRA